MSLMTIKERAKVSSFPMALFPLLFICFLSLLISPSCQLSKLEKKLDPVNAEFLSQVRYIITRKERKIFLELPASEKESFKEEFWKRRDYDPFTEENEFKMEYFNRIERANELFRSEARPGWLTDRGRIYILFGPPTDKWINPRGDAYFRCLEVWYYRSFPVVFADNTCSGNYRLITYNLSRIRSLNLMYMNELSKAQAQAQETIRGERKLFDFEWNVKKTLVGTEKIEGLITIDVPYSGIWFTDIEGRLETTLDVHLELKDSEGSLVWEYEGSYKVETDESELKESKRIKYKIEIPFILERDLNRLRQGKNMFHVILKNRTGDEELKKIMEFII